MNTPNSYGASTTNTMFGQSTILPQIFWGITCIVLYYILWMCIEIVYKYINRLTVNRTELLPYTYNMENKIKVLIQNPNLPGSKSISLSSNERSGIEFSYSFYLHVHSSAFRQERGLTHIFHKGYARQFPFLAPGVYMRSDTNTLRVYMNTYKTWNNFIEVDNFPVSKWVHVCIVCKENSLEIYINGNLSRKLSYDGFAPFQNFQDISCFSQRRIKLNKSIVSSLREDFDVFGATKGMLSRLNYFSYALCYAEIQQLMNEGPSTKMDSDDMKDIPPYLADTWWA
jgi:hypothetical protein